jgi:hypothetical protein
VFEGVANLIVASLLSRRRQLSLDFTLITGYPVSKASKPMSQTNDTYAAHTLKYGEKENGKRKKRLDKSKVY